MNDKLITDVAKKDAKSIQVEKLTLCRDDFIEWILKSTNDDSEFRVYKTKTYIMVGIDKSVFFS